MYNMKKYFLKYNEFLNESLKTARLNFLEKGLIDNETFSKISDVDPTPTKKYLDKMCEWFVQGTELKTIAEYIEKFHNVSSKLEQKDINKYTTFEQLKTVLDSIVSNTKVKKQEKKGVEIVRDDEDVLIAVPYTLAQSRIYGKGTKWCTTSKKTDMHWEQYYVRNLLTLYYIWFKNVTDKRFYKIAIGVDINNNWEEIRDAQDDKIQKVDVDKILKEYDISESIFVTRFQKMSDEQFIQNLEDNPISLFNIVYNLLDKISDNIDSADKILTQKTFDYVLGRIKSASTSQSKGRYNDSDDNIDSTCHHLMNIEEFKTPENFLKIMPYMYASSILYTYKHSEVDTPETFKAMIDTIESRGSLREYAYLFDLPEFSEDIQKYIEFLDKNPDKWAIEGLKPKAFFLKPEILDRLLKLDTMSTFWRNILVMIEGAQSNKKVLEKFLSFEDLDIFDIRYIWENGEGFKTKFWLDKYLQVYLKKVERNNWDFGTVVDHIVYTTETYGLPFEDYTFQVLMSGDFGEPTCSDLLYLFRKRDYFRKPEYFEYLKKCKPNSYTPTDIKEMQIEYPEFKKWFEENKEYFNI